jgi:hypothetical protein
MTMTADRFREILETQNPTPRVMREDTREVRRWASGRNPIDPVSAAWLEHQAALPPPRVRA